MAKTRAIDLYDYPQYLMRLVTSQESYTDTIPESCRIIVQAERFDRVKGQNFLIVTPAHARQEPCVGSIMVMMVMMVIKVMMVMLVMQVMMVRLMMVVLVVLVMMVMLSNVGMVKLVIGNDVSNEVTTASTGVYVHVVVGFSLIFPQADMTRTGI